MAAIDFLDKEFKLNNINKISSKMYISSPILWIEVDNNDIQEMERYNETRMGSICHGHRL